MVGSIRLVPWRVYRPSHCDDDAGLWTVNTEFFTRNSSIFTGFYWILLAFYERLAPSTTCLLNGSNVVFVFVLLLCPRSCGSF